MKRSVFTNPIAFIASGFGAGALPWFPGTWASGVGILFYLWFSRYSLSIYLLLTAIMIVLSAITCHITAKAWGEKDPGELASDEIAGFLVTMIGVPAHVWWIVIGFVLFRLFDIWKPCPICWFEKVPGGIGIVLDDVVAGAVSCAILHLIMMY